MQGDPDHFRAQAERAKRWADWVSDLTDRERLKAVACEYEMMALAAEPDDAADQRHR
jgi:hypothetical protein